MENPGIIVIIYGHAYEIATYKHVLQINDLAEHDPMFISLCLDDLQDRINCTEQQLREYIGFIISSQLKDAKYALVSIHREWENKQNIDFLQEIKIIAAQYKVGVQVLKEQEVVDFANEVQRKFDKELV